MVETILGILGSVGGITGLVSLFYLKQERRSKDLDNESKYLDNEIKQSEEWRKLYEEERDSAAQFRQYHDNVIKDKDTKIDELHNEISNQRDLKVELRNRNAELSLELTRLRLLKCETVNCPNRKPPTGY